MGRPVSRGGVSKNPTVLESLGVRITSGLGGGRIVHVNLGDRQRRREGEESDTARLPRVTAPVDPRVRLVAELCRAARQGNVFDVEILLDETRELLHATSLASEDSFGSGGCPLHYATIGNQPDVVRTLLARGCQASSKTSRGMTPLHVACQRGLVECASLLLDFNARMLEKDQYGMTPLSILRQNCSDPDLRKCRLAILSYYKRIGTTDVRALSNR